MSEEMDNETDNNSDNSITLSRRLALGSLLAGAALLPAVKANAACSPSPTNTTTKNVKTDFCAMGDGITDDTAAIQAAVNSGASLYFPPGTYLISDTIALPNVFDLLYTGSGKGKTIIRQTSIGKDAFAHTYTYFRISWRDLTIEGVPGSGHGIRVNGLIYGCDFSEMTFYCGGSGIYAVNNDVFSTLFNRCDFSSHDAHGIEILGGNTCTFLQCYAWYLPSDKYGYRVYGQALMLGCNGVNTGYGWGLFGANTSDGDSVNREFNLTCINCNFEDYTTVGVRLKYDGWANFINCSFLAGRTGEYNAHLLVDYCRRLIDMVNCTFNSKGATLPAGRNHVIYSPVSASIKAAGCYTASPGNPYALTTHYEIPGHAIQLATETVQYMAYEKSGTKLNLLQTDGLAVSGPAQNMTGSLVLGNTAGSAPPSGTPTGYLSAYLNGTAIRIPYYNA